MSDTAPAKKSLGQHFLTDPNCCRRIVRLARIRPGDKVLEIGPGRGHLTQHLLEAGARVVAVEFDRDMIQALRQRWPDGGQPPGSLTLIAGDFLKENLQAEPYHDLKQVVGNLPYNVSTRIIRKMMGMKHRFQTFVLMVQKEVAERMLAQPGSKDYGYFSLLTRYHFEAEAGFDVKPGAFSPPPKVMSHVLKLTPIATSPPVDLQQFDRLLRMAFASRRKTLVNNLKSLVPRQQLLELLQNCEIPTKARAEQIDLAKFICLIQSLPGQ